MLTILMLPGFIFAGCSDDNQNAPAPTDPLTIIATNKATRLPPGTSFNWLAGQAVTCLLLLQDNNLRSFHTRLAAAFVAGTAESINSPALCLTRADSALAAGHFDSATALFRRAITIDDNNLDARRGLAIALTAQSLHGDAVQQYRILAEIDPSDRISRFNLAVSLGRIGNWEESAGIYRQLLKGDPNDIRSAYNLASLLHAQGKLVAARQAWQTVIDLNPKLAGAYACLGEVLLDLDDPEQAVLAFAEAANLEPRVVSHWTNLALAARSAGQLSRSAAAWQRAITLSPHEALLWRELGSTKLEIHRAGGDITWLAGAVDDWRRSLELFPDQDEVARWIAVYSPALPEQHQSPNQAQAGQ